MLIVHGVPTYGKFGGPGWFAGHWIPLKDGYKIDSEDLKVEPKDNLDALFKAHDYACFDAEAKSGSERAAAEARANADLIHGLATLNPANPGNYDNYAAGLAYQAAAILAFEGKIATWDLYRVLTATTGELLSQFGQGFVDLVTALKGQTRDTPITIPTYDENNNLVCTDKISTDSDDNTLRIHKNYQNSVLVGETITYRSANGDYTLEKYDSEGNFRGSDESKIDPNGITEIHRDENGNITSTDKILVDPDGSTFEIHKEYTPNGSLKSETFTNRSANGDYSSDTYDEEGNHLSSDERTTDDDGNIIESHKEYNPDGSIKIWTITETAPDGSSKSYVYDDSEIPENASFPYLLDGLDLYLPPPPTPQGANDWLPNYVYNGSPLILDLDGDGVETRSVADNIQFDLDNNGFRETVGWVGADDGLLALDKNGDGQITGGTELFGNHTILASGGKAANGFSALAEYDDNKDGRIDANDAVFSQLKVWRDLDADGVSDAGELIGLAEAGVARLNLGIIAASGVDAQGNSHRLVGSYVDTSGANHTMTDVWFTIDPTRTTPVTAIPIPEEIKALPDAMGFGKVRSLRETMALDGSGKLKQLVEEFVAATDARARAALLPKLLFQWTGGKPAHLDNSYPGNIFSNNITQEEYTV
ncbi:MAG: hypothetical protein V2B20_27090, partial [Pseudomonadota bacterium]